MVRKHKIRSSLCLLIVSFFAIQGFNMPVKAAENSYIQIEALSYTDKAAATTVDLSSVIFDNSGDWIEYSFQAEQDGWYKMSFNYNLHGYGRMERKIRVTLNSTSFVHNAFSTTNAADTTPVRYVNLQEGTNTLRLERLSPLDGTTPTEKISLNFISFEESDTPYQALAAVEYTENSGGIKRVGIGGNSWESRLSVLFNTTTDWISYNNITLPQDGYYIVHLMFAAWTRSTLTITVNDNAPVTYVTPVTSAPGSSHSVNSAGYYHTYIRENVCAVPMKKGENSLRIASNSPIHINYVYIEPTPDIDLDTVTVGGTPIEDDAFPARGSDVITLDFNLDIQSESVTKDNVTLTQGTRQIDFTHETDKNSIVLKLKDSLQFDTEYELCVKNIVGVNTSVLGTKTVGFTTGGALTDSGGASISLDAADAASATGYVYSSVGQGISGRDVQIYLREPGGTVPEQPAAATVSGKDGKYEAQLNITGAPGVYDVIAASDYVGENERAVSAVYYCSPADGAVILSELNAANTLDEIEAFFERNQEALGIDLRQALGGIADVRPVYEKFLNVSFGNVSDLRKALRVSIALEKINQAASANDINLVLTDVEQCAVLGIDIVPFTVLEDANRSAALADLLELERLPDATAFQNAYNAIVNRYLREQVGIAETGITVESVTVNGGQVASIPISFTAEQSDISKIEVEVEYPEDSALLFENPDKISFSSDYLTSDIAYPGGNRIAVELTPKSAESVATDIGMLKTSVQNGTEGTFSAEVRAKITYAKSGIPYPIYAEIPAESFTVKVSKTPTSSQNSGGRPTSSGGKGSSGVLTPVVPVVPQTPADKPEADGVFTDLGGVEWAKESIYALYQLQIVNGVEEGRFAPDDNVTREEFVKLITTALGLVDKNSVCGFKDVSADAWYYPYVASGVKFGLVYGASEDVFGTGVNVTREEMAVMLYRTLSKVGVYLESGAAEEFNDGGEISAYAEEAVSAVRNAGIINGTGDNLFAPKAYATRAEAAKVVFEMIKKADMER